MHRCMAAAYTPPGIADLAIHRKARRRNRRDWQILEITMAELETHYLLELVAF